MNKSLLIETGKVLENYQNTTNITHQTLKNYSDYVRDRAVNFYFYQGGFKKANARTVEIIVPFYLRRIQTKEGSKMTVKDLKKYAKEFIGTFDGHNFQVLKFFIEQETDEYDLMMKEFV